MNGSSFSVRINKAIVSFRAAKFENKPMGLYISKTFLRSLPFGGLFLGGAYTRGKK